MDDAETAGVVASPPLLMGGTLALGLLLGRSENRPFISAVACTLGDVLRASGVGMVAAAIVTMKRAGTNVDAFAPATALVTSGPFAITRNPIYLAFAAIYLGIALRVRSFSLLALLPVALAVMERGVIDREERYLERRFGDAYRSYCNRVPRWL
jgi:protein-S-isoprenylcysteine O-methyltransferase Ste14